MRPVRDALTNLDDDVECDLHYDNHIAENLADEIHRRVQPVMPGYALFLEWCSWLRSLGIDEVPK